MAKALSRRYTPEQVERALTAVAISGNYATAAEMVKRQGFTVPRSTLQHWVTKLHRERFTEISNDHASQFREVLKADYRQLLAESSEAALEGVRKVRRDFAKLEPRDQAGALRNVATTHGIVADKLAALEGRPSSVMEHQLTADDLLLRLQEITGASPSPDLYDAEVVEEGTDGST